MIQKFGVWFRPEAVIGVRSFSVSRFGGSLFLSFVMMFPKDVKLECSMEVLPEEHDQNSIMSLDGDHREISESTRFGVAHFRPEETQFPLIVRLNKELMETFA